MILHTPLGIKRVCAMLQQIHDWLHTSPWEPVHSDPAVRSRGVMLQQSVSGTLPTPAHPHACVLALPSCLIAGATGAQAGGAATGAGGMDGGRACDAVTACGHAARLWTSLLRLWHAWACEACCMPMRVIALWHEPID